MPLPDDDPGRAVHAGRGDMRRAGEATLQRLCRPRQWPEMTRSDGCATEARLAIG